jgi:hypothetical protein
MDSNSLAHEQNPGNQDTFDLIAVAMNTIMEFKLD